MNRNNRLLVVALCVLAAPFSLAEETQDCDANTAPQSVAGVWRIVEASTTMPDGTVEHPYGKPAAGLFVYTPGGHLSLHLHKNPPGEKFTQRPSDSELGAVARGYIGYYGTWSTSGNLVVHHIEGAMSPNRFGQDAERPFVLCGDVLELSIEGRDGRFFYRRLERVESFSDSADEET